MIFALTRRGALLSMAASAALLFAVPALADDVTITFWGSYGNGGNSVQQNALNKTLIPAFEAAHPGIKVEYVDVPYDALLQKIATAAAGSMPAGSSSCNRAAASKMPAISARCACA